jgi:branched-chain amino acid transport system permease protein
MPSLWGQLPQFAVTGLANGSLYALIALGFNLIYNATSVVNFAQGEFVTLGALSSLWLVGAMGWPVPLALAGAVIVVTATGVVFERLAIRPVRGASVITVIIITIGASVFLRGVASWIWGSDERPGLQAFGAGEVLRLGSTRLEVPRLWIIGIVLVTMFLLWLLAEKTLVGKAMRACAINRRAAEIVGIDAGRMTMLSWALSAGLGALAGVIISPVVTPKWDMGVMLGLKGFAAAILGGMGIPAGAVAGGVILGLLESLGVWAMPPGGSGYKDAIAFAVMLIVLFVRPTGLLGHRQRSG